MPKHNLDAELDRALDWFNEGGKKLTGGTYNYEYVERVLNQAKAEAKQHLKAIIEREMSEQDRKSHLIGFKNGKWAMAQKFKSVMNQATFEAHLSAPDARDIKESVERQIATLTNKIEEEK